MYYLDKGIKFEMKRRKKADRKEKHQQKVKRFWELYSETLNLMAKINQVSNNIDNYNILIDDYLTAPHIYPNLNFTQVQLNLQKEMDIYKSLLKELKKSPNIFDAFYRAFIKTK